VLMQFWALVVSYLKSREVNSPEGCSGSPTPQIGHYGWNSSDLSGAGMHLLSAVSVLNNEAFVYKREVWSPSKYSSANEFLRIALKEYHLDRLGIEHLRQTLSQN